MDAVAALLEDGAFARGTDNRSPPGEGSEAAALAFLAAHLAANRASASGGMLLRVLRHLAAPPASGSASGGMGAAEREAVFTDIVSAAGGGMSTVDRQQARTWQHGMQCGGWQRQLGCAGWMQWCAGSSAP